MADKIILPEKYYLDYYRYILRYIDKHYKEMLYENELEYLQKINKINEDSLCMYLRIAGRRNIFFLPSKLKYEEIKNEGKAIDELLEAGLVESLNETYEEHLELWLGIYTKGDLLAAWKNIHPTEKLNKQIKKQELLNVIIQNTTFEELEKYFTEKEQVIVQAGLEEEQMIRFLFFGNLRGNITDFVVRDVGHRSFEQIDEAHFVPFFDNRKEVDESVFLSRMGSEWYYLEELGEEEVVVEWMTKWFDKDYEWTEKVQGKLDRLLLKIARFFERKKDLISALLTYNQTYKAPSRERQIRILSKLKKVDLAIEICHSILENPENVKEEIFAKDFLKKQEDNKEIKSTRKKLKNADSIVISQKWQYQVEEGVLEYYVKKKYSGIHSENSIWRTMFGIVLWDLLYDTTEKAIHNPFQKLPSDIYKPDFYEKRKDKIETCFEMLDDPKNFEQHFIKIFEQKRGIHNRLVAWDLNIMEAVQELYKKLKSEQIKAVLRKMAENIKTNATGFPDLFIWKTRAYWFVEVKSPTDSLSEQQLFWLEFFKENGIKSKVLKVEWR